MNLVLKNYSLLGDCKKITLANYGCCHRVTRYPLRVTIVNMIWLFFYNSSLKHMLSILKNKLFSLSDLLPVVQSRKGRGEKLVFTNGCFDLIHVGHLRYLEKARCMGDFLVIGLNSDESVRNLKGEGRPFVTEMERAEVLSALVFVDYILIFSDLRPYNLIEKLKPDFHVKGGDYNKEDLPEKPLVEQYGGKVVILEHIQGKSTTFMAEEICRKFK